MKLYFSGIFLVLVVLVTIRELSEMDVNVQSMCFLSFRL